MKRKYTKKSRKYFRKKSRKHFRKKSTKHFRKKSRKIKRGGGLLGRKKTQEEKCQEATQQVNRFCAPEKGPGTAAAVMPQEQLVKTDAALVETEAEEEALLDEETLEEKAQLYVNSSDTEMPNLNFKNMVIFKQKLHKIFQDKLNEIENNKKKLSNVLYLMRKKIYNTFDNKFSILFNGTTYTMEFIIRRQRNNNDILTLNIENDITKQIYYEKFHIPVYADNANFFNNIIDKLFK